ncbi:PolC-type DNA polymerase III [Maribacter sp. 2307ULW6-5]|uniref:3'-5' exonuclease n=1 Tax=Maribacter sp. 2307ULW6-5 TaxID=3386275 RepID=UPI0039BCD34C
MYSIVDIETTGGGKEGHRITEISIFRFDGQRVVDEFTSLVNPQCPIPGFITGLTGIDDAMVRRAPQLRDVAPKIMALTQDAVFVAHNVNFDYNIIKRQLKLLGIDFSKKKTVHRTPLQKTVAGLPFL